MDSICGLIKGQLGICHEHFTDSRKFYAHIRNEHKLEPKYAHDIVGRRQRVPMQAGEGDIYTIKL
jgi:hypothetical protein